MKTHIHIHVLVRKFEPERAEKMGSKLLSEMKLNIV